MRVIFPCATKLVNKDDGDVEVCDTAAERMRAHCLLPRFFRRVTEV
jgi:hypothetical protein